MKTFTLFLIIISSIGLCYSQEIQEVKIKWKKLTDLPEARRNLKAVYSEGKLYAIGGYAQPSKGPESSNFVYDIKNNIWSKKTNMNTPRSNFAIVSVKEKIYAIGGDKFLKKSEFYDIKKDKWVDITPMSIKRQHIFGDISGDNIYVAGGLRCWKCKPEEMLTAKFEVYNISDQIWTNLPSMPTPRQNPLLSIIGDKIFAIGGMKTRELISLVEVFNLKSNTWKKGPEIPEVGFYSGSIVYENKVFVLDGAEKTDDNTDIFVYNPEINKWSKATSLPYPVKLAGFTLKDNKIYVVGGCGPDFKALKTVYEGIISEKKIP